MTSDRAVLVEEARLGCQDPVVELYRRVLFTGLQLVKEAKLIRTAMSLRRTMVAKYEIIHVKEEKVLVLPAFKIKKSNKIL